MNVVPRNRSRGNPLDAECIGVLITGAGGECDLGPIGRQRLRHVLVGGSNLRPLRVSLRIVPIGPHQCSFHGVSQRGHQPRKRYQENRSRNSAKASNIRLRCFHAPIVQGAPRQPISVGPLPRLCPGRKLAATQSRFRLFVDAIGARRLNQQRPVGVGIINPCNWCMRLKISVETE